MKKAAVLAAAVTVCGIQLAAGQVTYETALNDLARLWSTNTAAIEAAALAERQGQAQSASNLVMDVGSEYAHYRGHLMHTLAMSAEQAEEFLVAGRVVAGVSAADFAKVYQSRSDPYSAQDGLRVSESIPAVMAPYWRKFQNSARYYAGCYDITEELVFLDRLSELFVKKTAKRLRAEGKSIVTVNGVNPLVEETRALFEKFNAPMMEGLEAAYQSATGDADAPTLAKKGRQARLQTLYQDVNDGTILNPTGRQLQDIRFLLGTAGYNAWVKSYNEGQP